MPGQERTFGPVRLPAGVAVAPDGRSLYVTNAKGAGSPFGYQGTFTAPGSFTMPDVNWMFGSMQKSVSAR